MDLESILPDFIIKIIIEYLIERINNPNNTIKFSNHNQWHILIEGKIHKFKNHRVYTAGYFHNNNFYDWNDKLVTEFDKPCIYVEQAESVNTSNSRLIIFNNTSRLLINSNPLKEIIYCNGFYIIISRYAKNVKLIIVNAKTFEYKVKLWTNNDIVYGASVCYYDNKIIVVDQYGNTISLHIFNLSLELLYNIQFKRTTMVIENIVANEYYIVLIAVHPPNKMDIFDWTYHK